MKLTRLVAVMVLVTLAHAGKSFAERRDDAECIANAMYSKAVVDEMFGSVGELMVPLLMGEMQRNGGELSEAASKAFGEMLLKEMAERMTFQVTEMYADIYEEVLPADELASYCAFFSTDTGRAVAKIQAKLIREAALRGEQLGSELASSAVEGTIRAAQQNDWPEGTPRSAQQELQALLFE
ncbi:MAG: DUF2059 domain-containing protein [Hyphomonadaceae bacterium]|nr:DUF2059 domain-containing protein [Hyphomonadaceae bacterium]